MLSAGKIWSHRTVIKSRPVTHEHHRMIAEAAYYMAEKRGFKGDCELHDWLEAEARIDRTYGTAAR